MNHFSKIALMAGIVLLAGTSPTLAADQTGGFQSWAKDRLLMRGRVIGVMPDAGGSTSIGGTPDADNAVVPELDFSYFFTKNIAAELILATSPHDLSLKNRPSGAADLDLGESMILPPTLTLQYHFTPDAKFSPYVGAGLNYTLPYSINDGDDVTSLDIDGSFGTALQVGADYWLNDKWGVNVDVKKLWVDVDAKVNGTIDADVDLDPWVVGAGVSYRF